MLKLKTAKNYELPITWIGISDFDGSLRFETTETNMAHRRCRLREGSCSGRHLQGNRRIEELMNSDQGITIVIRDITSNITSNTG